MFLHTRFARTTALVGAGLLTAGNDDINGKSGRDVIVGLAGNDEIEGNSGNDKLDGDGSNDRLHAKAGQRLPRGRPWFRPAQRRCW